MTSKLTREQLRERAQLKAKNLTYAISQSAFAGVRSELEEELQFLQCALACLEGVNSEPVAWTDEQELRDVEKEGCGYLFKVNPITPHADPRRVILLYRHAQPAPVVPDAYVRDERGRMMLNGVCEPKIGFGLGWNACRAAMLQELQKSAGAEATCRSNENVQVLHTIKAPPAMGSLSKAGELLHTNSPAQSDCCPAPNQGWIPVSEQMPPSRHGVLVGRWWGDKPRWCCKWATYIPCHPDAQSSGWLIPGASWTPTHWMPLPAAPQEVR